MPTLFTVRATLVLVATAVVAIIAFVLAYHASERKNLAAAALIAGGAAGGTLITLNQVLDS